MIVNMRLVSYAVSMLQQPSIAAAGNPSWIDGWLRKKLEEKRLKDDPDVILILHHVRLVLQDAIWDAPAYMRGPVHRLIARGGIAGCNPSSWFAIQATTDTHVVGFEISKISPLDDNIRCEFGPIRRVKHNEKSFATGSDSGKKRWYFANEVVGID